MATAVERPLASDAPKTLHPALKSGTKERHEQAENCAFIQQIMKGGITRSIYRIFLADLYYVYVALEDEAERNKEHAVFGALHFPVELSRREGLESDLEYFYGSDWRNQITCTRAAMAYVQRVHELGETDPSLLVAHSYARYLGDLSGGQILKYKLSKCLSLPASGEGAQFYVFNQIDDIKKFKAFYTGRMNSLDVDADTFSKIQEEAKNAFLFNIKLFEELDEIARSMPNGYKRSGDATVTDQSNGTQDVGASVQQRNSVTILDNVWRLSVVVLTVVIICSLKK